MILRSFLGRLPFSAWSAAVFMVSVSNVSGPWLAPFVALLILAWVMHAPLDLAIDVPFIATIAFILWSAITLTWAQSERAPRAFLMLAMGAVIFLCLRDLIRDTHRLRIIAEGYLLGLFVAAVRLALGNTPDAAADDPISRLTLAGFNANYLGYAFAAGLAVNVAIHMLAPQKQLPLRLISALSCITGLVLTDTRGAQVGALLLIIWLVTTKLLKKPPLASLLIVVGVTVVSTVFSPIYSVLKFFDFGERSTGDLSGRFTTWEQSLELWAAHPLFGAGFLSLAQPDSQITNAHNAFLEVAASGGLVGLMLLIALYVSVLHPPRHFKLTPQGALVLGAFIAASLPAYLSGAWDGTVTAWALLALFSRYVEFLSHDSHKPELRKPNTHTAFTENYGE